MLQTLSQKNLILFDFAHMPLDAYIYMNTIDVLPCTCYTHRDTKKHVIYIILFYRNFLLLILWIINL